jgi:predicted RNase H-like nuclease (RuvC/YqgF family)
MGTRHWPEDADDYVEELEQQLAKANERVKELERTLSNLEVAAFSEWLYEVKFVEGLSARDVIDSAVEYQEQLRKEQEK